MSQGKFGFIHLPTLSACALWHGELQGQFSDGMWENAAPHDHWKFWCGLTAVVVNGDPRVVTTHSYECKKAGYNIASLYPIVGERMLAYGRMGRAMELSGLGNRDDAAAFYALTQAAEHLQDFDIITFEGIKLAGEFPTHPWAYESIARVSLPLATAFYGTKYEMRDMRADVASIKRAMKTVQR